MIFKLPKGVKAPYREGVYDNQAFCQSSYDRGIDPVRSLKKSRKAKPRNGQTLAKEEKGCFKNHSRFWKG
jgi:GR25 family glycosyltransferase involved in LPS biosynthesis